MERVCEVEVNMKLLLDPIKSRDFCGGRIGVVVGLSPQPDQEESLVAIVGMCAAVERDQVSTELETAYGLATPDWEASVEAVQRHYPAGTCAVGVWVRIEDPELELELLAKLLLKVTNLKDVFGSKPTLLVSLGGSDGAGTIKPYLLDSSCSPLQLSPVECMAEMSVSRYLSQHTAMLRVRAALPLYITAPKNTEKSVAALSQRIRSQSSLFLIRSGHVLFSEHSDDTLRTAMPERCKVATSKRSHSGLLMAHTRDTPLAVELLEKTEPEPPEDGRLPCAPTLGFSETLKEGCVEITVLIDTLGLVQWDSKLGDIALCLKEAICAQLRAIRDEIMWKANTFHSVSVHHFSLTSQDSPVTILYPNLPLIRQKDQGPAISLTNQELQSLQEIWRKFFGLPPKSSQIRILSRSPVGSDLDWISSNNIRFQGSQLLCPHLTLKHTRVSGGRLELVEGNYLYYHYMQEGFNDDGWGCAYRSLQTLWSWFLLQGYTEKSVPTHMAIQETLVRVGDKEKSFVASKDWIGSFEVSAVLNQLLGIQCKIQYISNGGDMLSAGRVLLSHFHTEGTPVMIGGGVLAHTILGVDFSASTGEIQFLVLDPHYTGREDLRTILDKGWCGWKPVTFWDSTAHYNMCMPLVPE